MRGKVKSKKHEKDGGHCVKRTSCLSQRIIGVFVYERNDVVRLQEKETSRKRRSASAC